MAKVDSAFFTKLSHMSAILLVSGIYREADVFAGPDDSLFANFGNGYLRLYVNGSTSKASVRIHQIYTMRPLYKTSFGYLTHANKGKVVAELPDFVVRLEAVAKLK